jgi:hypothetical protein
MHRETRGEVRLDTSKSGALQHWSASAGGLSHSLPAATANRRCQSRSKARDGPQNCWYLANSGSVLSGSAQKVEVGGQNADSAGRPEAESSQESESGQPDGVAQLIEQLDHEAAETPDPAHEPIPLDEQSPAAGSAETAPHSDAAQSDAGNPLDATPKDAAQATATVPTENVSSALHSRAHTAKTRKASAPRRNAEPQRSVPQKTPARYTQPVSDGQLPRSYPNSDRGYGYGGPAPISDIGG